MSFLVVILFREVIPCGFALVAVLLSIVQYTGMKDREPAECDLLRIAIPANVHRPGHHHKVNK